MKSSRALDRLAASGGLAILVLLLGGCAATEQQAEQQAARDETLDEILSEPLDADAYGTSERCVSSFAARDFQALGERHLVFEGPGDQLWLNELRGRCPGLRHAHALAFDSRGSQICELDRFKITDVFQWSRFRRWPWDWMDGIPCTLGEFQPVSPEQVEAVRAALDQ
jgi:hypothetical protein